MSFLENKYVLQLLNISFFKILTHMRDNRTIGDKKQHWNNGKIL